MRRRNASFLCAGMLLAMSAPRAARADEPRAISVWYRSSSGCPDGDAFMRALQARSVQGRLAQVGDAIDFVVTLGPAGSDEAHGSSGVLERQTETGTVSIRRVDDASCEQVAEALALTLALAAQSEPGTQSDAAPAVAAPAPPPVLAPAPTKAPIVRVSAPVARSAERTELERTRLSLGLSGGVTTGIAPALLPGAALFFEVEWLRASVWQPALRLAMTAAFGAGTRDGQEIAARILGARIDGCPLRFGPSALGVRACVALELGQLQSEGDGASGRSDSGFWSSAELGLRGSWELASAAALEAQLGLDLPFTRYSLQSGAGAAQSVAYRTAALGGAARIGVLVHFP